MKEELADRISEHLYENRATVMTVGLTSELKADIIKLINASSLSLDVKMSWIKQLPDAVTKWAKTLKETYKV